MMTAPSPKRIARAVIKDFLRDIDYFDVSEMVVDALPEGVYTDLTPGELDNLVDVVLNLIRSATITVSFPHGGSE